MLIPAAEMEAGARGKEEQRRFESVRVAEHYEHSPQVFSLVLDSALTYSTGVFFSPNDDLETAQRRKFEYIRRLLDIQPGERVLDAGCGWGSNMLYLAAHTEGVFHGVTLSPAQRAELLRRSEERGLARKISVDVCHLEEFAAASESFDVVLFSGSIVHMRNREEIHKVVSHILRPSGRVLISDCYFPQQVRGNRASAATDYIFYQTLGYCLLVPLHEELGYLEKAGMDIVHVQDLTSSYVLTLAAWINNIRRNREALNALDPGFAAVLQAYMTVARLSFSGRTALEYMILATKGRPRLNAPALCVRDTG
jgi:cyclopropane-fatty-acyl-phospholipid synthase